MYLEDYFVGQTFNIDSVKITEELILEHAKKYDPRPFHIDKSVAEKTRFKKLFASGLMTLNVCWGEWVKTKIDEKGVIAGIGMDNIRWLSPVFVDDELHSILTVSEITPSVKNPHGVVKFDMVSMNQNDEIVLTLTAIVLIAKNPST